MPYKYSYIHTITGLIVIAVAFGAYFADRIFVTHYANESRASVREQLILIRDRLDYNLVSDIQLVKGLLSVVALAPELDQADFEQAVRPLFAGQTQLRNIGAAPDLVIRYVYPLEGNEPTVGMDYRTLPEQFGAVDKARRTRKIVLSGPLNLIQGGVGLVARLPVFLSEDSGEEYFWGVISAVVDFDKLIANCGLSDPDASIEIAIREYDAGEVEGAVFFGDPELFVDNPVQTTIALPGGSWQLAARSKSDWQELPKQIWWLRALLLISACLVLVPFAAMVRALQRASQAQVQAELAERELSASLSRLHERENLLRTVIDEMPDILVLKDYKGDFLLCNKAVADLYGTIPDAMIGKHDGDFGFSAEKAEFFRQSVLTVMAHGNTEIVLEDSENPETGEVRHFKSIKKPFKDADGNNQILVIAHDISDVIRAQKELAENETKLRTILDNVGAFIYLKNPDGTYLFANKAVRELWQVDMSEIIGHSDDEFFDAETAASIRAVDEEVLVQGRVVRTQESNTVSGRGATRVYQSTKLPLRGEDGSVYALCGISVDITELKQAEALLKTHKEALEEEVRQRTLDLQIEKEKAEAANIEKSKFLANMSHELRTPMHAILSFTELTQKRCSDDKSARFLRNIETSGKRLTELLDNLLDMSKLEAGKTQVNFEKADLVAVVARYASELSALIDRSGLTVECESRGNTIGEFDEKLIGQVIINLLSNALRYSPRQGVVKVRVEGGLRMLGQKRQATLTLIVQDQGVGIPASELDTVFDKFVQSSKTVSKAGGTGLGLPICKEIAALHHGEIWAVSPAEPVLDDADRMGSAFFFVIPAKQVRLDN